jgi:3-oxoadipate enol-lactonase
MPSVLVNGVNIYYESHGSGFPLVLAYGLGGNCGEWAGQIPAFSRRYRTIIWDPRGHGSSDSPPDPDQYGWDSSVEDLHGLLNHLEIPRAYVGGLSMGGGIAARFAVAHPERVAALLLIDSSSAAGLPYPPEWVTMRQRVIELCETEGMEAVAEYCIEANPNVKTQVEAGPEARERLRQTYLTLDPVGYANATRAVISPDYFVKRLAEITAPTLVLVGEKDPTLETARLAHTKIPGSQYVVIPDAGHLSNLDKPEEFNGHVLEYLQRVEAGINV